MADYSKPKAATEPVATKSLPSTRLEEYEDFERNNKVYKITVSARDYTTAEFTEFDYALLDDIDHGKPSKTPIADRLLGLEMIVRRIEEHHAKVTDLANTSLADSTDVSNPPVNATLSNLEGRDGK